MGFQLLGFYCNLMQGVGAFRIHKALGAVVLGFVVVVFGFGMLNSVTPMENPSDAYGKKLDPVLLNPAANR